MKSVCPVKVKINWRSGGGYRDNQPGPVVFKLSRSARVPERGRDQGKSFSENLSIAIIP